MATIDGPVRGIRSYVGANSGPLTQRTFHFHGDRYEIVTDLRVHAIPSVMSFLDFSDAAVGMRLGTSTMPDEVTVDGSPDAVPTTVPDWFSVSGPQGVLLGSAVVETSTPIPTSAFHYDRDDPPEQECWGDGDFLGATGARLTGGIPDTDPRSAPTATVRVVEYYGLFRADLSASAWAPIWAEATTTEVTVAPTAW